MLRSTVALLATALAVLTLDGTVQAHGSMTNPKPKFKDPYNLDAPSATMSGPAGPYQGNDEIKGLAEKAGSRCGQTDASHVQAVPSSGAVEFKITAKHIGPCEVWLGNTKVASARDCWSEFKDFRIPVDFSKCGGSCQLRWVWLATHNSPWEFYDNCVQLGGGGGGNGGNGGNNNNNNNGGNSTVPTRAPKPTRAPQPQPGPTPVPTQAPVDPKPEPQPQPLPTQKPRPTSQPEPKPEPKPQEPTDAPATVRPPSGGDKCFKGKDDARLDSWCMDNCAMGFCPVSHCKAC